MAKKKEYKLKAKVWLWQGQNPWHFINVDKKASDKIKKDFEAFKKGWGSLPVKVSIKNTKWETSIFPDKRSGTYLLPLKASVRKSEEIIAGDTISFQIKILA